MEAAVLEALGAVPGVLGSLLVNSEGELLLHCLPFELAPRASAAAPRLAVLLDALAAGKQV